MPGVAVVITVVVGFLVVDSILAAADPTVASIGVLPTLGDLLAGGFAAALGGILIADGAMLALRRTRLPLEGP